MNKRIVLCFRISRFIASAARAFFTQRARFRTFTVMAFVHYNIHTKNMLTQYVVN
jgi:hypothetical protein